MYWLPLECRSKGLRTSKAKFPHQPQSSWFVRTLFSLLWVPGCSPCQPHHSNTVFLTAEQSKGFLTRFRKKRVRFRWCQKSFVEPKQTGSLTHLQFAPSFTVILGASIWGGGFSVDLTKLLGCSAQVIWQDIENVYPGLSAVLQLHGIFHCT